MELQGKFKALLKPSSHDEGFLHFAYPRANFGQFCRLHCKTDGVREKYEGWLSDCIFYSKACQNLSFCFMVLGGNLNFVLRGHRCKMVGIC